MYTYACVKVIWKLLHDKRLIYLTHVLFIPIWLLFYMISENQTPPVCASLSPNIQGELTKGKTSALWYKYWLMLCAPK